MSASTTGFTREELIGIEASRVLSDATDLHGASVLRVAAAPDSAMLNRIVGLGIDRPATEADVDEALAAIGPGVCFYIAVAPAARPAELPQWLRARGLEPGWGWMIFRRGVDTPPAAPTALRLVEVSTRQDRRAFARVVRASYGLPEGIEPTLAAAPDNGWHCFLALHNRDPAGAGAVFVDDSSAYLGLAGTLPGYRGQGAQSALLTARIRRARELGCDLVVTETGQRRDDRPSNSYRNILRAGFSEVAITRNWVGRS
ncbi:MAG: GNAT family N-acetyltransferase [Chloroflexota bacterium]|nr:GNAT family N-acetyltransferase [Chloroflexota bacterium]